jgi:two-component system LytT family sensor kinase
MAEQQRTRRRWLEIAFIFAAWTVFGLLMANQTYMMAQLGGRQAPWLILLRGSLLDSYLWAVTTLVIFWLARRFPLERSHLLQRIPLHVVAAIVLALARAAFMVELSQHVEWLRERDFGPQFWGSSGINLTFYALLLGFAHAVLYYERYRERERAAEQLSRGLTEARLQALKMQLQPHFLFNTLHAISALIPAEAKPARQMIARLGDLLRMSLDHEETQEVTLREELAFLEPYLEIEQARLDDRLTIAMNIAPETLDARVPHLLLQPLVENAIRHGIAPRIEPGRVEICASKGADGRSLHLEVRDDGRGVNGDNQVRTRRGVGLNNIKSRLEQLYNGEHRFELDNHPEQGVVVRITLPFRRAQQGARKEEAR